MIYQGWKLDFKKFRIYLKDKFRVSKAFIFIGFLANNESLYKKLSSYGYELIYKPTIKDQNDKAKGNVDAELVLHSAAIEYDHYDKAVIVSGDGDFYCLHEFLLNKSKLGFIVIPNTKAESTLLKKFHRFKIFLEFKREILKMGNKNGGRRS